MYNLRKRAQKGNYDIRELGIYNDLAIAPIKFSWAIMMMKSDSLDGTEAMLQILDQCILKCYDSYSEAIESLLDDEIRESYKDVLEGAVLRILDCERLL